MTSRHRQIRTTDMQAEQLDAYVGLAEQIVSSEVNPFHPRDNGVHLTWLSLYAAATGSLDENKSIVLNKPSAKVQALVDLLDDFDGVPTVVFTTSGGVFDVVRIAMRTSPTLRKLVASESYESTARGRGLKEFTGGAKDVLLTTTYRYIGLSYERARRAVFLQRPWSDGAIAWIEDALPDDCEIVTYVSAGTVECLWPHDPNRLVRLAAVSAANPESVHNLIYGKEE